MSYTERLNPEAQYVFTDTHAIEAITPELIGAEVSISGRALARRESKRFTFFDLHDDTGKIQVVSSAEATPEHPEMTSTNIGDVLGVNGVVARTKKGELSVMATDWVRLAKTQHSFPDARSGGLTDPEAITRQRYLNLATNPTSMARFQMRSKMVSEMRRYMEGNGFMEVETPILQPIYGGAAARPFITHHNAHNMEMYLRIAPELYLKRLVVGGMKRVFEIGRVFRNEGIDSTHNPEFTMMEAYAAGWDFEDQMKLTEDLVSHLAMATRGRHS